MGSKLGKTNQNYCIVVNSKQWKIEPRKTLQWYIIPNIKHVNTWRSVGSNRILMSRFITSFWKSAMDKNSNSPDHKIVREMLYSRMQDEKGEGTRLIYHPQNALAISSLDELFFNFLFLFLICLPFCSCFQRVFKILLYTNQRR